MTAQNQHPQDESKPTDENAGTQGAQAGTSPGDGVQQILEATEFDRSFDRLTPHMADYYDNEVRAESRGQDNTGEPTPAPREIYQSFAHIKPDRNESFLTFYRRGDTVYLNGQMWDSEFGKMEGYDTDFPVDDYREALRVFQQEGRAKIGEHHGWISWDNKEKEIVTLCIRHGSGSVQITIPLAKALLEE